MNRKSLINMSRASLVSLARTLGISGLASIKKADLVEILLKNLASSDIPPFLTITTKNSVTPVIYVNERKKKNSKLVTAGGTLTTPSDPLVSPERLKRNMSSKAMERKLIEELPKVPDDGLLQSGIKTASGTESGNKSPRNLVQARVPFSPLTRNNLDFGSDNNVGKFASLSGASESRPQKSTARDTTMDRSNGKSGSSLKILGPSRLPSESASLPAGYAKDRVVVLVRDPHWIHCYWEISKSTLSRAQAALGQDFEGAQPALRLVKTCGKDGISGEQIVREFHLPEGARNWYLDVPESGTTYCVDVGYRSRNGRFYGMARSNSVATPKVAWSEQADTSWTEQDHRDAERLFALSGGLQPNSGSAELRRFFEEKLGHNPGSPAMTSLGSGGFGSLGKDRKFSFQVDADLVVYGSTEPSAKVSFQGEPIPLRPDGTFSLRFRLTDGRHILPAVSISCTGMEERTIILAVERNTKQLEPVLHEENE